ncbi:MAG: hypothetical protein ACI8QZ_000139 [Chlamydiales bacterium]|jgi:hypothetical protein
MTRRNDRMTPEQASSLARQDRRRVIVMVVGVALLGASYFYAQNQSDGYSEDALADVPRLDEIPTERVVIPEFDMLEVFDDLKDSTPESRLVLEAEALDAVFDYGRLFTPQHYKALDPKPLNTETLAALEADPGQFRVSAFRARGEVLSLKKRRRNAARPEEITGTLALEGGGHAHFVVLEAPAELEVGAFARIDGVFLKLYRSEGPDGWWDGPLLCGARAAASVPRIDLTEPIPMDALAQVRDDTLELATGLPEVAEWQLMARALAEAEGTATDPIDWSTVPLLDDQTVGEVFVDGEAHRGKPFRFEILRNLDGRTEAVDENPLRIDKITTGWIASQTWKGPARMIHYRSPFDKPVLSTRYGAATYITGHGFFFKNMSYETHDGNLGRVPVFILAAVEPFAPPEDTRTKTVMWGILGATVLLGFLLLFLLLHDKQKARVLQAELVRRRRARRAPTAGDDGLGAQGGATP